jgi:outer membrane protein
MKHSVILFFALLTVAAQAQTEYNYSLSQAIEFALKNQQDVLNAQLETNISHYKVKEIVGMGLPQIKTEVDFKDFIEIPTTLIPAEIGDGSAEPGTFFPVKFGTRYQATAGVSASQILFDPSYLLGVKASKTYREISEKSYTRTRIETAVQVTKAYYYLLVLQETKPVVDANVVRVKKLRDDTKAMYENGFVEKIDLDRLEVIYNNVQTEQERFARRIEMANAMLKFQMGMNTASSLVLTDSLNTGQIKNLSATTENFDINKRVEYNLLKTQQKFGTYNVKRFKQAGIPKLYLYGSISTSGYRDEFNLLDQDERWYPTGLWGATLSFPIFDGFSRHARVKQTEFELQKINNQVTNFENSATIEIQNSRNDLLNAISTYTNQEKNLQLATEVSRTSKIKYDQGVGSNLEILDAETSLKEAQANYYNAIFDALIAKVNLDKALGNITY